MEHAGVLAHLALSCGTVCCLEGFLSAAAESELASSSSSLLHWKLYTLLVALLLPSASSALQDPGSPSIVRGALEPLLSFDTAAGFLETGFGALLNALSSAEGLAAGFSLAGMLLSVTAAAIAGMDVACGSGRVTETSSGTVVVPRGGLTTLKAVLQLLRMASGALLTGSAADAAADGFCASF